MSLGRQCDRFILDVGCPPGNSGKSRHPTAIARLPAAG
jgi:hypothetical protein